MLAALALGAAGVQMGTRFIATVECEAHAAFKRAVVDAPAEGSPIYSRAHHASRGLATPIVTRLIELERSGASAAELAFSKAHRFSARVTCCSARARP
jgi:enoyl-[acyl-carrier protein] reductase II